MAAIAGRVLILPRGIYNNSVTYTLLDIVYYENATYICKKTSLGNLPTNDEYWQVMVEVPSASNITPESLGIGYGVSTTAESNTAKLATLTDYQLKKNGIVAVRFNNAVLANSTLNINNAGTKPIYNRGSAITDGIIKGGDIVTMIYDGTNYDIISVDRAVGLIDDLENVTITSATDGQVLMYDSTNHVWKNATISTTLAGLEDVTITSVIDGNTLIYDTVSGKWINSTLALNGLSDVDITTPTDGQALVYDSVSGKWINGEGIDPALADNVEAILDVYGAKNFNVYPYKETTKAENGLNFTDSGDGSIPVSGTASADTNFNFHLKTDPTMFLKNGVYKVSGCPAGGSSSDGYFLVISYKDINNETQYVYDEGNGATFTLNGSYGNADGAYISFYIQVKSGTAISTPLNFKPMIRDARITDDTFVPYAKTNKALTEDTTGTLKALGVRSQTITADGVKTWNDYLVELCNLVNTGLDSSYWIQFSGFLDATNETFVLWTRQGIVSYNTEYALDGLRQNALNNLKFNSVRIATTSSRCYMNSFPIIPSSASGTSLLTTKPSSGTNIYISYYLYKQI